MLNGASINRAAVNESKRNWHVSLGGSFSASASSALTGYQELYGSSNWAADGNLSATGFNTLNGSSAWDAGGTFDPAVYRIVPINVDVAGGLMSAGWVLDPTLLSYLQASLTGSAAMSGLIGVTRNAGMDWAASGSLVSDLGAIKYLQAGLAVTGDFTTEVVARRMLSADSWAAGAGNVVLPVYVQANLAAALEGEASTDLTGYRIAYLDMNGAVLGLSSFVGDVYEAIAAPEGRILLIRSFDRDFALPAYASDFVVVGDKTVGSVQMGARTFVVRNI